MMLDHQGLVKRLHCGHDDFNTNPLMKEVANV